MQFFIGIVPSIEYKLKIIEFQQRWKNNIITEAVEPHITLKAQGGLTPDIKWISKVKEVCSQFQSFQISLSKPMFFGDDVVYLSVNSKELYTLHNRIVRKISPTNDLIKKYFELDDFVPHLTLGQTYYGLTKHELRDMAKLAKKELSPFPTFAVSFIRVYKEIETNKYEKYLDIPFS
ncbi:2'-5' RNA ligase family protein [Lederbergia sp. NSJ-179]|uniref:2'-5' RNA ligase family protein n=1 Tax=Lederbergia sp. NSJ-179 TaxID=2931402 RepID=UPI001FD06374|nr:2'-5' RNA ligase family protein [Lederbergia sp. NSJ-179]MCJ7842509.1 2'-5' RNA ligase family protein [Lederbergia sp. NSJ-179]